MPSHGFKNKFERYYREYLSGNGWLFILLILLFIIQFYLTWNFSSTELNTDYIGYFVEPFIGMENYSFFTEQTQYRPWIGYPMFLIPLFEIFGMTAEMLRNISIFFTALSLPMGYLAFREWFNPIRALSITLIPLTWTRWVEFRYNEMPIVLFLTFLTIYLFLKWFNTRKKIYLYSTALLSGFGFYIKANQLYTLNALIAGALTNYKRIIEFFDPKILAYCLILFLIGVMPFLAYTVNVDFDYLTIENLSPDYDDHPNQSTTEVRINQLKSLTEPELSILNEWGVENFHIFQLLFITGLLSSIYSKNYFFAAGFLTVFVQFYYVPTDLNSSQIINMIPFYLFVVGENLKLIPEKKWFDYSILIIILVGVAFSISSLKVDEPIKGEEQSFTTGDFENYSNLELDSSNVLTNSYNMWLISTIDLERGSYLIHKGPDLEKEFSYKTKMEEFNLPVNEIDNLENSDLILLDNCGEESCTIDKERILERGNYRKEDQVTINSFEYSLYSKSNTSIKPNLEDE